MPNPIPKVNAFIICDAAFQMPAVNKFVIVGTFDTIFARRFPAQHPSLSLYVNFTSALGEYDVRMELADVQGQQVIGTIASEGKVEAKDKLGCVEFCVPVNGLVFPRDGEYEFRLFADDKLIGLKRIRVLKQPEPQTGG